MLQEIKLKGGGLYHLSMGAVLGISAYGRTQEKINPTTTTYTLPEPPYSPNPSYAPNPSYTQQYTPPYEESEYTAPTAKPVRKSYAKPAQPPNELL